jgi:hypothetical protein
LGLKNSGGGGAITCFEDTTGSPAKIATACDAIATTVSLNKSQILLENIWRKSYYILEARLALLESRLFELWADFYCISLSGQTL